ncbi:hypothetical protein LTR94_025535, partial [Friedmanniomyces endolithicus]
IGSALGLSDTTGLTDAFSALDEDADGVMSVSELQAGLEAMGPPPPPPPTGAEQETSDADGGVTATSGASFASAAASAVLDAADANEDGVVSLEELMAAMGEQDSADFSAGFTALDADADGGHDLAELTAAFEALNAQQSYGRRMDDQAQPSLTLAA